MASGMTRVLLIVGLVLVGLVVSCVALLPERYAVNVPLRGMIFGAEPAPDAELQRRIALPPGFSIRVFADGISNARFLRFTASGALLVSSPREGAIFLLEPDRDGDGRSDGMRALLDGLDRPHGMDFRDGWLYVAEAGAIRRGRFDPANGTVAGELETVVPGLPDTGNHWTKTLRFGPDGWMYLSIGSSCNVCLEDDPRRAAMLRFRPDGTGEQLYATGLRNSVGFDWRPGTGELWAVDNGRDLLGDDLPPGELNQIVEGGFYGWPFVHGADLVDPDFGAGREAERRAALAPEHGFVAHVAPLGMTFYRGRVLPAQYRGAAFVAQHGSWNRSEKSGYRVVSLHWDAASGQIRESDFAVGFELDEQVVGRPVDIQEGPDGALYISDDYAGAIYRVSYAGD